MGLNIAKLVSINIMTRVIVDVDATDEEVLEAAKANFHFQVDNELSENLELIQEDTEVPFSLTDATNIALTELKANLSSVVTPESFKSVISNRVKELLGDVDTNEFDLEWDRITSQVI